MNLDARAIDTLEETELQAPPGPWGGRLVDWLIVLIPASQFIEFHVMGRLFAPDILLLAMLPLVLSSRRAALAEHLPRTFLLLGLGWLSAQVATDLMRETPFEDYARGWAMIALMLSNFSVLFAMLDSRRYRVVLCATGNALGGILSYAFNPADYAVGDPWKFGYGYAATLLIVLFAAFLNARRRKLPAAALMLALAGVNLFHNFRSLAGECFVTAALLLLTRPRSAGAAVVASSNNWVRPALIGAGVTLATFGLLRIYGYSAETGLLGYRAWQKYEIQSSGRYGILVGGRAEFFTGLEAVVDSPIVGHGSWAKDWRYSAREETLLAKFGYRVDTHPSDSWIIPSHSYLIGAWVDAGALGAIVWLWTLSLPLRSLRCLYEQHEVLAPLMIFLTVGLFWDVLFSPFGADRRFTAPFVLSALMWLLKVHPRCAEVFPRALRDDEILNSYDFV